MVYIFMGLPLEDNGIMWGKFPNTFFWEGVCPFGPRWSFLMEPLMEMFIQTYRTLKCLDWFRCTFADQSQSRKWDTWSDPFGLSCDDDEAEKEEKDEEGGVCGDDDERDEEGGRWIPNDVSFSVWSTAVVFPPPCFSQLCCDNQFLFLLIIQDPFHLTLFHWSNMGA